jgi:HEAT repeat protein
MKKIFEILLAAGLAARGWAQAPPPAPPAPPAPAALPAPFAHESALAAPPAPPEDIQDRIFEAQDRVLEMQDRVFDIKDRALEIQAQVMANIDMGKFRVDITPPMMLAQDAARVPIPKPRPMPMEYNKGRRDNDDRLYRRGKEDLDQRAWEKAADEFNELIVRKAPNADGACYWKAYALSKLGRRDDAVATLAELQKSYPSSQWLNDAKALEAEVKQANGQAVSPESQTDDDLKLMAISSLVNSDPERAVPLLEGLLKRTVSPKLKERALFVLAQSGTPKAREIVVRFAKGAGNPDLQLKAVEYLGYYRGKENGQTLAEIYAASSDVNVKRTVLRGFMAERDTERLLNVAKTEPNPDLRREAIIYLGNLGAQSELGQLYNNDQTFEVKKAIIDAMRHDGNTDKLMEIARTDKDPNIRISAIRRLGEMRQSKTAPQLASLYTSESEQQVKKAVVDSLCQQNAAKEVVELARKESDLSMKKIIVERLSNMHSKEGTDYMMELLNK